MIRRLAIASTLGMVAVGLPQLTGSGGWSLRQRHQPARALAAGKRHAHDQTRGTPVNSFKRSNRLYRKAMTHNPDLDRDPDRIACGSA